MRIVNSAIYHDLERGIPLKLNLGAGERTQPGFYNVDLVPLQGVDVVADLNLPLALIPDNCVTEIRSRHTLEHVRELLPLLAEIHRICVPDARIEITTPHFSNPLGYSDPTHLRFFGLYTFHYFCDAADQPSRKVPGFYMPERFRVESVRFNLMKRGIFDRIIHSVLQAAADRSFRFMEWYERRLCWLFPVSSIQYVLRPKKTATNAAA